MVQTAVETTRFQSLPDYPFARLRALLDPHEPGAEPLNMAIGEPQGPAPAFVLDVLHEHRADYTRYPPSTGTPDFRAAVHGWLTRRYGGEDATPAPGYGLRGGDLDPDAHILPCNGTREALFAAALIAVPEQKNGQRPAVLIPNPFYQCYAAAALAAGADPIFVDATRESGHLPDFASLPEDLLARTAAVYLCSPANPQGVAADHAYWSRLYDLAAEHGFVIFADECYSEIWLDQPPTGALAVRQGTDGHFAQVLAFHSLSKRSGLAGLRSGFVAGDARLISGLRQLREYGGAPNPLPVYAAAAAAWRDEDHVEANRARYRAAFAAAENILKGRFGYFRPDGGFFLWLDVKAETGLTGEEAALLLWRAAGVRVLPGQYLARDGRAGNPGTDHVRIALVHDVPVIEAALRRMVAALDTAAQGQGHRGAAQ